MASIFSSLTAPVSSSIESSLSQVSTTSSSESARSTTSSATQTTSSDTPTTPVSTASPTGTITPSLSPSSLSSSLSPSPSPSSQSSDTKSSASSSSSSTLDTGKIVGITVPIVVVVLLLLGIAFFYCRRRRRRRRRRRLERSPRRRDEMSQIESDRLLSSQTSAPRPSFFASSYRGSPSPANGSNRSLYLHIKPSDIKVVSTPQGSQTYLAAPSSSAQKPMPVLPDVEPTSSGTAVIEKDLPQNPPDVPELDSRPTGKRSNFRPVSEITCTSIATSHELETPKRPTIAAQRLTANMPRSTLSSQRPHSIATSTTSFEDDFEVQSDDVPPVPSLADVHIPNHFLPIKLHGEKPTRLNLTPNRQRDSSKTCNTIQLTPNYDNGNIDVPTLDRSQLQSLRGVTTQRPHLASTVAGNLSPAGILFNDSPRSSSRLSSLPAPGIPPRYSSLQKTGRNVRKLGYVSESSDEDPSGGRRTGLRPSPVHVKRSNDPLWPIRGRDPNDFDLTTPLTERPSIKSLYPCRSMHNLQTVSESDATEDEEVAIPLAATERESGAVHRRDDRLVTGGVHPITALYIPEIEPNGLHEFSLPDSVYEKAVVTPNKTKDGELVLMVDL